MKNNGSKILLISFRRDYPSEGLEKSAIIEITQNDAINSISGYLNANGIEAKMLEVFYKKPDKIVREKEVLKAILEYGPNIIGISVMNVDCKAYDYLISKLKILFPKILFIVGGYAPTSMPERFISERVLVVASHGEIPTKQIIKEYERGKIIVNDFDNSDGLNNVFRVHWKDKNGKIRKSKTSHITKEELIEEEKIKFDFDNYIYKWTGINPSSGLPWYVKPAWHIVNIKKMKYVTLTARRGCRFACSFCLNPLMNKGQVVRRDPILVVSDLKKIIKKGCNFIFFSDEEFLQDIDYTKKLLETIIKEKVNNVQYTAMVSVRNVCGENGKEFTYSKKICNLMKNAGFEELQFGVESGSQLMLNKMQKCQTINQIKAAFSLVKNSGINTCAMMIMGGPNENFAMLEETQRFVHELRPDRISMFYFGVFPGTLDYIRYKNTVEGLEVWMGDTSSPYLNKYPALELDLKRMKNRISPQKFLSNYRRNLLRNYYGSIDFFEQEKEIFKIRINKYNENKEKLLESGRQWFLLLENNFTMNNFTKNILLYLNDKISKEDVIIWSKKICTSFNN